MLGSVRSWHEDVGLGHQIGISDSDSDADADSLVVVVSCVWMGSDSGIG